MLKYYCVELSPPHLAFVHEVVVPLLKNHQIRRVLSQYFRAIHAHQQDPPLQKN